MSGWLLIAPPPRPGAACLQAGKVAAPCSRRPAWSAPAPAAGAASSPDQPRWPLLDAAQQEVPHRVEADRTQPQSVCDSAANYFECEGLQQSQHLDVFAAARLAESCFQQSPQREEAVRQLPAHQRSSLVQGRVFCSSNSR